MPAGNTRILAWLIAMPALLCAVGLPLYESSDVAQPPAMADTFVEALDDRNVEHAYLFIRQGQDPNTLVRFRDDVRTGGREVQVSPLMLAVAGSDDNTAAMLLSFGARMDYPPNRYVVCLAREMGMDGFVDSQMSTASEVECPPPSGAEFPLLAYVD
ncbi:MAG: hypothetical protein O2930_14605 [Acidobacteria bacterium]|nr:hypothetical protein [Acidobacteriota bacterium]